MTAQWSYWAFLEFLILMKANHFGTNEAKFHLAKADFTFDPDLGVSQFTEADFPGYAPVEIQDAPFGTAAINDAGSGEMDGTTVVWTRSTTGSPQTIYGWWLALQDDSAVILAERITPTISLVNADEEIRITVDLLDCTGSCS